MMGTMVREDPRQERNSLLAAEDVVVRFGRVLALGGVTLTVDRGQCLALVGESGSGKTTILRCFNRMVNPAGGRVLLDGRDLQAMNPIRLRRRMGYVPQEGGLMPHWRVERNAALVPWLEGDGDPRRRGRMALERVGLDPGTYGARWPHELSGGQRQRVAIARALAAEPEVVLLDEPFGALDAITRDELQEMFEALRTDLAMTAVLVTHDLREAMRLADRIAVLKEGTVRQVAAPGTLREEPEDDYVRQLLSRAGVAK
jgi:osmoprotectant transport system ATP-binding protein